MMLTGILPIPVAVLMTDFTAPINWGIDVPTWPPSFIS